MRNEEEMIAYALEIDPQILPFAPTLLADLDELGSDAELIVEVLQTLHLPKSTHVIDLGCGKGAVTFEIAEELGWQVLGVDLFAPFIEGCREQAKIEGVADLCSFVRGDVLKLMHEIEPRDIAIFAALGDVLGSCKKTIEVVRQYVRPGGHIVISDGFIKDGGAASFARFENYASHEETLQRLTSSGDVILKEILEPTEEPKDEDDVDEESALIFQRASVLAKQHPDLAEAFFAFAADQKSQVEFMQKNFASAIWLLQRT